MTSTLEVPLFIYTIYYTWFKSFQLNFFSFLFKVINRYAECVYSTKLKADRLYTKLLKNYSYFRYKPCIILPMIAGLHYREYCVQWRNLQLAFQLLQCQQHDVLHHSTWNINKHQERIIQSIYVCISTAVQIYIYIYMYMHSYRKLSVEG